MCYQSPLHPWPSNMAWKRWCVEAVKQRPPLPKRRAVMDRRPEIPKPPAGGRAAGVTPQGTRTGLPPLGLRVLLCKMSSDGLGSSACPLGLLEASKNWITGVVFKLCERRSQALRKPL